MPKRILIELMLLKQEAKCTENHLVIELERHKYTPEYIVLTKDFYLKM
jgi:tRNA1Val (adenine37-N6)-methyltransferase